MGEALLLRIKKLTPIEYATHISSRGERRLEDVKVKIAFRLNLHLSVKMKLLLYISALVLIIGCATPVKHSYFTFDEVEYYSIRIAEPEVNALFVREDSLDTDSLRL